MKRTRVFSIAVLSIVVLMGLAYAASNPTVNILTPGNNSANNTENSTQPFIFNVTDWNVTRVNCTLRIDGVTFFSNETANETSTTYYANAALNQSYQKLVNVECASNNATSRKFSFNVTWTIDLTSPSTIGLGAKTTNPADGLRTNAANMSFFFRSPAHFDNYFENTTAVGLFINGVKNQSIATTTPLTEYNLTVNFTAAGENGWYNWSFETKDNASNAVNSTVTRGFLIDHQGPNGQFMTFVGNVSSGNDLVLQLNYTAVDNYSSINRCFAKVYTTASGSAVFKEVNGTFNRGNSSLNGTCIVNVNTAPQEGAITAEPWIQDALGNNATGGNVTNSTYAQLYPGWNLVEADRNMTLSDLAPISTITQVSILSLSNNSFTSFVTGTSSNGDWPVTQGDAVYVYAGSNLTVNYVRYNWTGTDGGTIRNLSVSTGNFSTVTRYNTTGVKFFQICGEETPAVSQVGDVNITYITYVNATKTYSYKCGGTNNNETLVAKGRGFWLSFNQTAVKVTSGYRITRT